MSRKAALEKSSRSSLYSGIVTFILLLALSLAVFVPRIAEGVLAGRLSKELGLPVRVKSLRLRLLPPQLVIKDLELFNPQGFPAAELASISQVKGDYFPPGLLVGRLGLAKLEIDFKEMRLVRNQAGKLNIAALGKSGASGETVGELTVNLGSLTYTDLSEAQPVQKTFDLGLRNAVYRNVKGISGIKEIIHWEILKRTGLEEEKPPVLEIKPIAESQAGVQNLPAPAPEVLPESAPSPPAPSPVPSAPKADGSSSKVE